MRTLQRVGAGLCALTLFAGLAACGDDDTTESDDATETTEAGGEGEEAAGTSDEFCGALAEFNGSVMQVDLDESSSEDDIKAAGEQLGGLSQTLADEAPEDLADTATELNAIIQALNDGDASEFQSDATFETYMGFVEGAIDACDFETVDVTAVEYAFEGVPETIGAGTVAFSFSNEGGEEHEMILVKKAEGVTQSFEEIANLPEEESESLVEFRGATYAAPGEESSALAELDPGEYAMLCFIPVGGDDSAPPHFTKGMLQEFTVE
jgi:hypothetical protein